MLQPQDIPVPHADDLVIEILTDQMIDFDESEQGCAADLRGECVEKRSELKSTTGR